MRLENVKLFRQGGCNVSSTLGAFFGGGRYYICAKFEKLLVVDIKAKSRAFIVESLHSDIVTDVVNIYEEGNITYFASCDSTSLVCFWQLHVNQSKNTSDSFTVTHLTNFTHFKDKRRKNSIKYMIANMTHQPSQFPEFLGIITLHCADTRECNICKDLRVEDFNPNSSSSETHDRSHSSEGDTNLDTDSESKQWQYTSQKKNYLTVTYTRINISNLPLLGKMRDSTDNPTQNTIKPHKKIRVRVRMPEKTKKISKGVVSLTACGKLFAFTLSKTLYVVNTELKKVLYSKNANVITAASLDPCGRYIVTGDTSGRVIWWFLPPNWRSRYTEDLYLTTKQPEKKESQSQTKDSVKNIRATMLAVVEDISRKRVLKYVLKKHSTQQELYQLQVSIRHWHSKSVQTLAFTGDAMYLISAGAEGVLVFWHALHFDHYFLSGLGSCVTHLTVSDLSSTPLVATHLLNNSLSFYNYSTNKRVATFYGLFSTINSVTSQMKAATSRMASPTHFANVLDEIISPQGTVPVLLYNREGSFQTYDILGDEAMRSFNIYLFNTRFTCDSKLFSRKVQRAYLSKNGAFLVTAEYREIKHLVATRLVGDTTNFPALTQSKFSGNTPRYYYLRFWSLLTENGEQCEPTVITEIDKPHINDITALSALTALQQYQNNYECDKAGATVFISTSLDSYWKLWMSTGTREKPGFSCTDAINFRSYPCFDLTLFPDQSLVAILHHDCISIWAIALEGSVTVKLLTNLFLPQLTKTLKETENTPLNHMQWVKPVGKVEFGMQTLLALRSPYLWMWDIKEFDAPVLGYVNAKIADPKIDERVLTNPTDSSCLAIQSTNDITVYRVHRGPQANELQLRTLCQLTMNRPILMSALFSELSKQQIVVFDDTNRFLWFECLSADERTCSRITVEETKPVTLQKTIVCSESDQQDLCYDVLSKEEKNTEPKLNIESNEIESQDHTTEPKKMSDEGSHSFLLDLAMSIQQSENKTQCILEQLMDTKSTKEIYDLSLHPSYILQKLFNVSSA